MSSDVTDNRHPLECRAGTSKQDYFHEHHTKRHFNGFFFFTSLSHPILLLHFLILPPPHTLFMALIPYHPLPTLHTVVPTYRTIRQHIAKDKGRITERQENVTSHRQELTKQKHLDSVYISQRTRHESMNAS